MPVTRMSASLLPPNVECFSVYESPVSRTMKTETARLGADTLALLQKYGYPDQLILQWGTNEANRDIVDVDEMATVTPEENIQFIEPTVDMHFARNGDAYEAGISTWRIGGKPIFNTIINSVAYRLQPGIGITGLAYIIRGVRRAEHTPKLLQPSAILPSPILTTGSAAIRKFGEKNEGIDNRNAWRWQVR